MDPTLDRGEAKTITDNDLRALDAMGYRVAGEPASSTGAVGREGVAQRGGPERQRWSVWSTSPFEMLTPRSPVASRKQ